MATHILVYLFIYLFIYFIKIQFMRILRLKFLKYSEYVKNVYEANIFFFRI